MFAGLQYAKSITIDANTGQYTLVNPKTVVCGGSRNEDVINASLQEIVNNAPCYVKSSRGLDGAQDYQLFYLPAGSTTGSWPGSTTEYTIYMFNSSSTNLYTNIPVAKSGVVQAQGVSLVKYDPSQGAWEYLKSNNRSAYPDSGISGGYEYEYLGVPLDNAVGPVTKIETGSYVGTGTYGQNNPNTLTFGFAPKLVIIGGKNNQNTYGSTIATIASAFFMAIAGKSSSLSSDSSSYEVVSITENSMSWYATENSASYQFNVSGESYHYIAIG